MLIHRVVSPKDSFALPGGGPRFGQAKSDLPHTQPEAPTLQFDFDALDRVLLQTGHLAAVQKPNQSGNKAILTTKVAFRLLPPALQDHVRGFLKPDVINTVQAQAQSGTLGILEEATDVWYESLVTAALQSKLVSAELLQYLERFIQNNVHHMSYEKADIVLQQGLPQSTAQRFSRMTGLSLKESRFLLAMTYLRLASLPVEGRFTHPVHDTRVQLLDELAELKKHFQNPGSQNVQPILRKLEHLLTTTSAPMATRIQDIQSTLVTLLNKTIGPKASYHTLESFYNSKHLMRQIMCLSNLDNATMTYESRKAVLKPFEAVIEADLAAKCV